MLACTCAGNDLASMRTLLTSALLILGASALGAQQDSTARRDSLLARERRRIAGEAVSRVPERPADAALGWRSRIRVGVGAASGSTWLEEQGGHTVSSGIGPTLAVEARFPRPAALEYLLGLRASRAPVTVDAAGSYDGDAIYVMDLSAGAARRVGNRLAVRGELVGALVAGGGNIAPFAESSRLAPGIEVGGALRITDHLPLWLALGAQALRYGAGGNAPTGAQAGTVYRILVELRHGR
jgi:hypothetical protein